jgi:hypothetical protein
MLPTNLYKNEYIYPKLVNTGQLNKQRKSTDGGLVDATSRSAKCGSLAHTAQAALTIIYIHTYLISLWNE